MLIPSHQNKPLLSFGVISDGVPRYYRHSLHVLQRAVKNWNHQNLKFSINFGDIVDGFFHKHQSLTSVNKFRLFNGPTYHMIVNHCLYNLPRDKLLPLLNIRNPNSIAYYEFSPIAEFQFVVLDGYDVSAIGWPKDHPNTKKANSPNGLIIRDRRFLMFNGAVGKERIKWLDRVLGDATKLDQKVGIGCHVPLDSDASSNEALLWNYNEVMDVVHRYSCVKACLAGHDHKGRYSVDSHGVHHRILEAALECPPGTDAFGRIDVFHDRLLLCGED
ncbi:hypothetical protein MIMGU_mgv1a023153mg [Erythranthe guttata]|uniref:Manganese-dependent ADP-ribose/CDP-alcohol diphosphatase n=1 Tax=Erythranthe guttata TaxID=4155 RepID=A0A022R4H7_ERYGU|nr:hypothetical protein MIMGU_mgv1a023153mg [Erythranthe guttata]